MIFNNIYEGKKVLMTGNTGFKGSWLTTWLLTLGADVYGYSLNVPTDPSMFEALRLTDKIHHRFGDIRNREELAAYVEEVKPDFIFHLAAQALVLTSYKEPFDTITTNVVGTAAVCEAIRQIDWPCTCVLITSDKAYDNVEWIWGYRETDRLGGKDIYSGSKGAAELVIKSYWHSFIKDMANIKFGVTRAGNVIGGGDYQKDRIVPDCVRAAEKKEDIIVRNPNSVRPYQHVLEPLFVYLEIAEAQYRDASFAGYYNVGPDLSDCLKTGELAELFCRFYGEGLRFKALQKDGPHEAGFLRLDNTKLKETFAWHPRWRAEEAVRRTVEYVRAEDKASCMEKQIRDFLNS